MEKLRSVNTKFWNDPYIETLDSKEKLLFLYLLTNPLANILGIYEISINRISFDTGLTIDIVGKALKGFEKNLKVFYLEGFIVMANFQKNQNMNLNMEKGAIELFKKLPNKVKTLVLDKGLKGFERLSNGFKDFEKYESESEEENEVELQDEVEETNIDFDSFWNSYHSISGKEKTDKEAALKYWNKLTTSEKQKALDNIQAYCDSISDKKYIKKARTYLSDKNFNDEFGSKKIVFSGNFDDYVYPGLARTLMSESELIKHIESGKYKRK